VTKRVLKKRIKKTEEAYSESGSIKKGTNEDKRRGGIGGQRLFRRLGRWRVKNKEGYQIEGRGKVEHQREEKKIPISIKNKTAKVGEIKGEGCPGSFSAEGNERLCN